MHSGYRTPYTSTSSSPAMLILDRHSIELHTPQHISFIIILTVQDHCISQRVIAYELVTVADCAFARERENIEHAKNRRTCTRQNITTPLPPHPTPLPPHPTPQPPHPPNSQFHKNNKTHHPKFLTSFKPSLALLPYLPSSPRSAHLTTIRNFPFQHLSLFPFPS